MDEFKHGRLQGDGVGLHFAAAGDDDPAKPMIVFVHGFPEFWYAWRRQLGSFGRDHLAVAYDQRGYNLSDKPEGVAAYRSKHLVADLAGVIRHFGRERAIVVGHDWGGVVAWAFALAFPEMVEKLVICNAPHPGVFARLMASDEAQKRASAYIARYREPDAEAMLAHDDFAVLRQGTIAAIRDSGHLSEADEAAYLEAWRQPGAVTGMLNLYRAMQMQPPKKGGPSGGASGGKQGLDASAVTVRVPTLVIWGMEDRYLLAQNLEGLEAFVPELTVHRIADATHWVVHERGDEVERTIRAFVAR